MNDLEIKDIDGIAGSVSQLDKLKNLLIAFGVKFHQTEREGGIYVDMVEYGVVHRTAFAFFSDGEFSHITENENGD